MIIGTPFIFVSGYFHFALTFAIAENSANVLQMAFVERLIDDSDEMWDFRLDGG